GRRVARTGTGGSVVFVQMDQQTIADYPVGGAATTPTFRYAYASYIDEPVVRKGPTSTSTVHFYHRNQQYSVTAITTSTGAIAERYAYTAYGQPTILNASGTPLSPQTSTLNSRYSYTGREWDATLGLHHFRARWMSPNAGRFLGRDPIGYEGGVLLYFYVNNKALRYVDPSGLVPLPVPGFKSCPAGWTLVFEPPDYDSEHGEAEYVTRYTIAGTPYSYWQRGSIYYEWEPGPMALSPCCAQTTFSATLTIQRSQTFQISLGGIKFWQGGITGGLAWSWQWTWGKQVSISHTVDKSDCPCFQYLFIPLALIATPVDEHWNGSMLTVSPGVQIPDWNPFRRYSRHALDTLSYRLCKRVCPVVKTP
ncbi:MAG: RHS repeat-associated core domain-containing protein, partial [Planctomycetota bacterium]